MELPSTLGDFRIHAVLGAGGSGIVYEAEWGPRRVALKVLHAHFVGTEKERAQFFAEAQRLAAIGHPHVVKVLAVGALPDGRPYLAMELLAGETLASVLGRGPMEIPAALALFGELCGAVAALHAQGLVHRNLKPENVFVVSGKHAVLLDFGIAKEIAGAASTVTQDGGVRGTPAYMAPERFFGQPAGVATDVYELAVICYAMLAGRLPWDDLLDPEARLQPRSLVGMVTGVPEDLDVELRRALSTRAANRPESALALDAALRAAAGAIEPNAAETAPMRKDAVTRAGAAADGAPPKAWFAERAPTTDRGRTPLAWAPDPAPKPAAAPGVKAKKPWRAIGAAAVAAIAAGAVVFVAIGASRNGDGHDAGSAADVTAAAAAKSATSSDPWASHDDKPAPAPAPVVAETPAAVTAATPAGVIAQGPARSASAYRAEVSASLGHLPADTKAVVTVEVDDIMGHAALAKLVHTALDDARVNALLALAPPCTRTLVGEASWVTYGAPRLDDSSHGTMIAGGRWRTDDVAACFGATGAVTAPGVWHIREFGYLARIDDHTLLLTNRSDLDAAALTALAKQTTVPATLRAELAALPADRAVGFVVDRTSGDDFSSALDLPTGTGLTGWMRVEADGIAIDGAADPHDVAVATRVEGVARPQMAPLALLSDLALTRRGSVLRVAGHVTDGFLATITSTGFSK